MFIADVLGTSLDLSLSDIANVSGHAVTYVILTGGYDVYNGPRNLDAAIRSAAQWPVNEPLSVVPAMAAATKNLGFGVTIATTYELPYHLVRRLSTVDHLTKGR